MFYLEIVIQLFTKYKNYVKNLLCMNLLVMGSPALFKDSSLCPALLEELSLTAPKWLFI